MTNENQAVAYQTAVAKVNDTFVPMITEQLTNNGIHMDDYQKSCVLNAMTAINQTLSTAGISIGDQNFDRDNLTDTLLRVAALKLNPAATPREVFFQTRNVKRKVNGKDVWMKQIEMGLEGDGHDSLLSRFGRDVKTVHQFWAVREDDVFVYPKHRGIELTPPEWEPKGEGKVIRVVYPIEKVNGVVEYWIAERVDTIKNLIAHVKQNLMNETFGIAKDRYNATKQQKEEIDARKDAIIKEIQTLGVDAALEQLDPSYEKYISPAWKEPHSREAMLLRKMRNNAIAKYPKDFGNAYISSKYDETTDESVARVRKDITENANQIPLDFDTPTEPQAYDTETGEKFEAEIVQETHKPHVEKPDMYEKAHTEQPFTESTNNEPF